MYSRFGEFSLERGWEIGANWLGQISQIVRILNSHLSQLQMIDRGTAELQSKVSAVQKAGQSLGSRLGGYGQNGNSIGVGGNAADDFYRSYMGRR